MGYTLTGWADVPVQIRYVQEDPDQFGAFLRGVSQSSLAAHVTVQSGMEMRESLGGVMPGQMEHAFWVRIATPAHMLPMVVGDLTELCNTVFPRVRGDEGQGPTASY